MQSTSFVLTAGLFLALGAHAQPVRKPFISATGRASVFAAPDQVKVSATITTQAASAQVAAAQNGIAMNALLDALRKLLGPTADIKTTNFNVYPIYSQSQNQPPTIVGYSASNTVEVTLAGTSMIGPVIDTAVQNGTTSLGSLQFGLKDYEPARNQALRLATQQAKNHAEAMASGVGRTVGGILSVQESAGATPIYATAGADTRAPTVILPGSLEIQATVVIDAELN
jgi:uncharacterized protein YggE